MKQARVIVFIIWGVLCFSLLGYAVVLSSMTFLPTKGGANSASLVVALGAGSATMLSFLLRLLFLGGFTTSTLNLEDPQQRGRFVAGNIVVFALSEGVGVLGFVNGILSNGRGEAWLPYLGLAFILMLVHIPLPARFKPAA
ncbi:hypothetical protein [Prosthecobacter sp.]|uniref:hypothetical protein n=1 Tax=Prosthecobacter sp. TaxID=1965333 RepID=UPI0037834309